MAEPVLARGELAVDDLADEVRFTQRTSLARSRGTSSANGLALRASGGELLLRVDEGLVAEAGADSTDVKQAPGDGVVGAEQQPRRGTPQRRSRAAQLDLRAGRHHRRPLHAARAPGTLPAQVHDTGDRGFISTIAAIARKHGVSGHPGDGTNRWAAVHRSDAALSLAKAPAGARVHAVAEEGVPTREISEALGRALDLPVTSIAPDDIANHFGWIAGFFSMDLAATGTTTQRLLGWTPTGPTLVEDIDAGAYSVPTT